MARFILHTNQLSERGTETSLFFLARALEERGHIVAICYDKTSENNRKKVIEHFQSVFQTIPYSEFDPKSRDIARNFDIAYFIKTNGLDGKRFRGLFNAMHIVFPEYLPHGNTYSYVSETLARQSRELSRKRLRALRRTRLAEIRGCLNARNFDFVDHIVEMPEPTIANRVDYGIPNESFLIIRYGGRESFDIPWVKKTIIEFLTKYRDSYFLAINTPRFTDSNPQIIYLDTVVDLQEKANLLNLSDVFLHARTLGESFGMSIVESLQIGKPVLAWSGGRDKNHKVHLEQFNSLYSNPIDLMQKLENLREHKLSMSELKSVLDYGKKFRSQNLLDEYLQTLFMIST